MAGSAGWARNDTGPLRLGIDVGSVSVKTALVSADGRVIAWDYRRHLGQVGPTLAAMLQELVRRLAGASVGGVGITGTGGRTFAPSVGGILVNEVMAHLRAADHLTPAVQSIIDVGGQDARLVLLDRDAAGGVTLADFAMNSMCAAGTGSFLDQQASRLGVRIEGEFGELALRSHSAPRIAGRCSVFAKSDMIHLQQKATPDFEIIAGLCDALARTFLGSVGKGKTIRRPVGFHGGVASNLGMVAAFRKVLDLSDGDLVVDPRHACMGAIGAALSVQPGSGGLAFDPVQLAAAHAVQTDSRGRLAALRPGGAFVPFRIEASPGPGEETSRARVPAYLGVDVGSISTNVVVMSEAGDVLSKRYLMTAGRPIEAVRRGLAEVGQEVGSLVEIRGACTTGSGRYLIGDLIGADVVKNEITAHARAAVEADPLVDTVFEIGGQDSKYISLSGGRVVDFEMNKACAAGTGSFLEEQAERLGLRIEQFGDAALQSRAPVRLGERCTVFMESDLVHCQQAGADRNDLVAGLSVSIVENYLNRVVSGRKVGDRIFFQGGVAFNKGVVSAFEAVTGKPILVPEHHEVMGAIGCCLIAREAAGDGRPSSFKGFDLSSREYTVSTLTCRSCANQCEINRVQLEGERPLFYGGRCEKYDIDRRSSGLPDLFAERERLLASFVRDVAEPIGTIGVPRALLFHDYLPFFATLLAELKLQVVVSNQTTQRTSRAGTERSLSEVCFPAKVALGHVAELLETEVPYLFVPHLSHAAKPHEAFVDSVVCPYVQAWPYMARASSNGDEGRTRILSPPVRFDLEGDRGLVDPLADALRPFGISRRDVRRALPAAHRAQREFGRALKARGAEVLASLGDDERAMVVTSRPYNGCDRGLNLNIPQKFDSLGTLAIPMDMLPLDEVDIHEEWHHMFWRYGQRLLAAAEIIRQDSRLFAVYITNFGCGPDSFIGTFFRERMGGKPFLQLEIDEHSADTGVLTRCEAFLDSLKNVALRKAAPPRRLRRDKWDRARAPRVYLPAACDLVDVIAAAFRACGVQAEVLPEPDASSVELGRQFTSGRECYPCTITTGDLVRLVRRSDFQPDGAAFFMPSSCGPCRFGMYHVLHRMVLDKMGFPQVAVLAPEQNETLYDQLGIAGSRFVRVAWNGIVAAELLGILQRRVRPYETDAGRTDLVYRAHLGELCRLVEQGADVEPLVRRAGHAFAVIPIDRRTAKPRIGVVGEVFVRMQSYANDRLIERLEQLGAEVTLVPFMEWIEYLNVIVTRSATLEGIPLRPLLRTKLESWIQSRDRHRLESALAESIAVEPDGSAAETVELGSRYVHPSYDAETILSLGKACELHERGFSGIVNVMPFTCMPGSIAAALFKPLRDDHDQIPVLNLAYDGQQDAGASTRLEAFLEQCRQHDRRRGDLRSPPHRDRPSRPLQSA